MTNLKDTNISSKIDVENFVGRDAEITTLIKHLSSTKDLQSTLGNIAIIYGKPGQGRRSLALVLAQRTVEEFPGGYVVVSIRNKEKPQFLPEIFETIIHKFDPFALLPDDSNELVELYNTILVDKKALIIIDGAVNSDDLNALTPPKGSALLITSEHPINHSAVLNVELKGLTNEDAEKLISTIAPENDKYMTAISRHCCHNPLVIYLAAGFLANDKDIKVEKLSAMIEPLEPNSPQLLSFFIKQTYDKLDKETQETFCKLSVFPTTFSLLAAAELLQNPGDNNRAVKKQLNVLKKRNLIISDVGDENYKMHSVVREFAMKNLRDSYATHFSMACYCEKVIEEILTLSDQGSDGLHLSLLVFDNFKDHIKQSLRWILDQDGKSPRINELSLNCIDIINTFGRLRFFYRMEVIPQLERSLAAAELLNNKEKHLLISEKLAKIQN